MERTLKRRTMQQLVFRAAMGCDLRKLLDDNGWTVEQFAALCGVLPARVVTWVTGSDSMPIPRLQELSAYIVRARHLLAGKGEREATRAGLDSMRAIQELQRAHVAEHGL